MNAFPEKLVDEFLSEYQLSGTYLRNRISDLAELAASEDSTVAEAATRTLFTSLIERLADSFEPQAATLYNRVFAQIIQTCRSDPRALALDRELTRCGLLTEEDMVLRANALRRVSSLPAAAVEYSIKRVIVLSRVTLGADVAITSVILERLKCEFPAAELVLVGGEKTTELFGGDPRLQFKSIGYRRGGALIERLLAWIELLATVRELTDESGEGEYLVIDPDSRLTQLGLLPVTKTGDGGPGTELPNYLFFPSREYGSATTKSLAQLANEWLDEVFGVSETALPRVSLKREDVELARLLAAQLRGNQSRRLIAINFGVGENPLKRVGGDFETSLIEGLCDENTAVILDKGAGAQEAALVDKLIAEATRSESRGRRARVVELRDDVSSDQARETNGVDILLWNGRIGMLAALIGESDLYIGYDSAGQHIAAALGVPAIDIFAGWRSQRMVDRWRPTGNAESKVIAVETSTGSPDEEQILAIVRRHIGELLSR